MVNAARKAMVAVVLVGAAAAMRWGGAWPARAEEAHGRAPALLGASWQAATPFSGGRAAHQALVYQDRLYVLGGYAWGADGMTLYNDVQYAKLRPDGAVDPSGWQQTEPFKTRRSGHGAVLYQGTLYVIGGGDGRQYFGDVQLARIGANGAIDRAGWKTSPHALKVARSVFAALVAETESGPMIFVVGGVGAEHGLTVHFDTVESAHINPDGSVGPWSIEDYHFKGGRSAPGGVFANHRLYVIGGWGDLDEDILGDVQYASVDGKGVLGPWHTSRAPLAVPRYGHSALLTPGSGVNELLVLGGNAGSGIYLDSVQAASFVADFDLARWTTLFPSFSPARWGQSVVFYRGRLFVVGGAAKGGAFLNDVLSIALAPPSN
jgi:Kelch motif